MSLSLTIALRVDASPNLGSGHLVRCYSLAQALAAEGHRLIFICRCLPSQLQQLLQAQGFSVLLLPPETLSEPEKQAVSEPHAGVKFQQLDAEQTLILLKSIQPMLDWLIVDHYQLDAIWEMQIRPHCQHLLVIDDLANRRHDCDLILDQNPYRNLETRYDRLLPQHGQKLLGPTYLLLRPEFLQTPPVTIPPAKTVNRILVTMGGSDPKNMTAWVLRSLLLLETIQPLEICLILGADFADRAAVEAIAQTSRYHSIKIASAVTNMATWMNQSDLAIAAGGSTTYELAYLGIPALIITASPTQIEVAIEMDRLGINCYLGPFETISEEQFLASLTDRITNSHLRQAMSERGKIMFKPDGVKQVMIAMTELAQGRMKNE
jgi:UDP-2,4-diacetamido-2,4,6-trideoxy-beta-L-altropyranose hydrolase